MHKIERVSCFFRFLFQVIFMIWPLLLAAFWIWYAPGAMDFGRGVRFQFLPEGIKILYQLSPWQRLLGFVITFIPMSINLYILTQLIRLFKNFEFGKIFSPSNITYTKRIGYALLFGQIVAIFYQAAIWAAMTIPNPAGSHAREIAIGFQGNNIAILLAGLLLILVSWIMAEGYKLHAENQLTV